MKIKKTLLSLSIAVALTVSGYCHADWAGDFELGVSDSRGNTETTTISAQTDLNKVMGSWKHNISGQFYYAKSGSTRAAENCFIGYKPRYLLTDRDYLFSFIRYGQDEYASVHHRTTGAAGYGRQLFSIKKHYLEAELGLGGRQTIYVSSPGTSNLDMNEFIFYLGGKYTGHISKTANFSETVRIESGQDNSYVTSITSLGLDIIGSLSAKISYIARYNTDVTGENGKRLDSLSNVNLVYSF